MEASLSNLSSILVYFIFLLTHNPIMFAFFRRNLKDYQAWLGIHNVERAHEEKHKQVLNISQLVYGPEGSDIVLLKLSRWVEVVRIFHRQFLCLLDLMEG